MHGRFKVSMSLKSSMNFFVTLAIMGKYEK